MSAERTACNTNAADIDLCDYTSDSNDPCICYFYSCCTLREDEKDKKQYAHCTMTGCKERFVGHNSTAEIAGS